MAERKYDYVSTKGVERAEDAERAYKGLFGLAATSVNVAMRNHRASEEEKQREEAKKQREAEALEEANKKQDFSILDKAVNEQLYGSSTVKGAYQTLIDSDKYRDYYSNGYESFQSAMDVDSLANTYGISEETVKEWKSSREQYLWGRWMKTVDSAIHTSMAANAKAKWGAESSELSLDTSISLSENLARQTEAYNKQPHDIFDPNGELDPSNAKYAVTIAYAYGNELAKDKLPEMLSENPLMTEEEAVSKLADDFNALIDTIPIKDGDSVATHLKETYKKDFRGVLDGSVKSSDPAFKSYNEIIREMNGASQARGSSAQYELQMKMGDGVPLGVEEVNNIVEENGLNPDNYFDAQQIVSLYKSVDAWNLVKSGEHLVSVVEEVGGQEAIVKMMRDSAMSSATPTTFTSDNTSLSEASTEITVKEGETATAEQLADQKFNASCNKLLTSMKASSSSTVTKNTETTQFGPLVDKFAKEYGLTDEEQVSFAAYVNKLDQTEKKTILAGYENQMQEIVCNTNLTNAEKEELMLGYKANVPSDIFDKWWGKIDFDYATQRDQINDQIKAQMKITFDDGGDMFMEMSSKPGYLDKIERWLIATRGGGDAKDIEEFVTKTIEVYANDDLSDKVIESANKLFKNVYDFTDASDLADMEDMPIMQLLTSYDNGDYHLHANPEAIMNVEAAVTTQFRGGPSKSTDEYLDMMAIELYGSSATYKDRSPSEQEVIKLNFALALGEASVWKVLDQTFGKEATGNDLYPIDIAGFGRGAVNDYGTVYVIPDLYQIEDMAPEDFLIGHVEMAGRMTDNRTAVKDAITSSNARTPNTASIRDVDQLNLKLYSRAYEKPLPWLNDKYNEPVPVSRDPIYNDLLLSFGATKRMRTDTSAAGGANTPMAMTNFGL